MILSDMSNKKNLQIAIMLRLIQRLRVEVLILTSEIKDMDRHLNSKIIKSLFGKSFSFYFSELFKFSRVSI